jgi:hypothetical protein
MESCEIQKANAALARKKRRRAVENNSPPIRSSKRCNASTSSAHQKTPPQQHVSTPLVDITNTYQQITPNSQLNHSQTPPNTQPTSLQGRRTQPTRCVRQTTYSGVNLLKQFAATIDNVPSISQTNNETETTQFTEPTNGGSESDSDSEIEILLDEDSSSESDCEIENDQYSFRRNKSHTMTGNSALQGEYPFQFYY